MTFNPSEELKDYINECPIQSYRLVDGSYMIAEEVDHDMEEGEDWKVDNGIAEDTNKFQKDTGFKSPIDIHMEWRRKHQGNN